MMETAALFPLAYALDLAVGDPAGWPHPARLLGRLIDFWRRILYARSVAAGLLFWLAVMLTAAAALAAAGLLLAGLPSGAAGLVYVYMVYALLATRSLHSETAVVERALRRGDLSEARRRLSHVVGRDTGGLDQDGVRRALIETIGENLSDGVVAPLFYLLLFGLPGMVLYKTINTLDSMVGYRSEEYDLFGRVAARADDAANYIPARLSAFLVCAAAGLTGMDCSGSIRVLRRDGGKTASPNAGRPEAAAAGALGIRLGGAASYFGSVKAKPYIGDAIRPPDHKAYDGAVRLLYASSLLAASLTWMGLVAGGVGAGGLAAVVLS